MRSLGPNHDGQADNEHHHLDAFHLRDNHMKIVSAKNGQLSDCLLLRRSDQQVRRGWTGMRLFCDPVTSVDQQLVGP